MSTDITSFDWSQIEHVFSPATPYATVPIVHTGTPDVLSEEDTEYYDDLLRTVLDAVNGTAVVSKRKFRPTVVVCEEPMTSPKVREWIFESGARVQLWTAKNSQSSDIPSMSWALVYASTTTFLVGGLRNYHPFVVTPAFRWDDPSVVDVDAYQAASLITSHGIVNLRKEKYYGSSVGAAITALSKMVSEY